jgi:hypothetical protein
MKAMMTPPPAKYPRRRRRRLQARTTQAPPTPPVALAVVAVQNATFSGTDGECELVFNTTAEYPLSLEAADPLKWTARFADTRYVGASMELIAFNIVLMSFNDAAPQAGPDVIGYSNAPSDVSDGLGRELAAFANFPM